MSDFNSEIPQGLEGQAPQDAEEYIPNDTPVEGESELSENPELTFTGTGNENDSDKGGESYNPAWNPALENIPKEFHQFLVPEFKKWDENYNKVQSQYSPYKPLVENNVPYAMVQQSLQLAQALNADPRAVYEELGRRYGFSGQGQNQADDDDDNDEDNDQYEVDENGYDPTQDPRMQPYFEQQRMVTENLLQRQQIEVEREAEREIQNAWMDVEKKNGRPLTDDEKQEVLNRSLWISDQTGAEPDLRKGYDDYTKFVSKIRGQRANNSAPDVLGGNGGLPAQRRGITGDMTDDQRQDYIAERIAQLNKSQSQ